MLGRCHERIPIVLAWYVLLANFERYLDILTQRVCAFDVLWHSGVRVYAYETREFRYHTGMSAMVK